MNKNQKYQHLSTLADLKNLSLITDLRKKFLMKKKIEELNLLEITLNHITKKLEKCNNAYQTNLKKFVLEKYDKLKKSVNEINYLCKKQWLIKAKVAKITLALIKLHNKTSHSHNIDEIKNIIAAIENENFIILIPHGLKLKKLIKNFAVWNILKFRLHFLNLIKQKNVTKIFQEFKIKSGLTLEKMIRKTKKNILKCEINYENIFNMHRFSKYAKWVKKLDKISHKKTNTKNNSINDDIVLRGDNAIQLKDVTKYYYNKWMVTKILKNINLEIKKGEFVVILGPSGSGKTSLLNIITGIDVATSGQTYVNGQNLINKTSSQLIKFRKLNIGYIFQSYNLLPNLTVRENVEIGWKLQKNRALRLNINELLSVIGIDKYQDRYPYELSGGQQQRVSIARSMAKNPAIIFGDEPTGAVDEEMSKQILKLFVDLNKKYKTTVVIVTHNSIFADLATRVIKVNSGQIIQNYINHKPKTINQLNWSK